MNESISLRSNVLTSNQQLQKALNDKKTMARAVDKLQNQVLQLKQLKMLTTTPRSIIVNNLLNPPLSAEKDSPPSMPIPSEMAKDLKGTLDRAMSADEALYIYTKFEDWLGTEALQSVTLVTCCVCQEVRFRQAVGFSKPRPLNEFIERDLRLGCENPYLGNEKAEFSVIRIYDTILQLMQALYFVEPRLTSKARKVAARLHFKMIKYGLMHSPFDQRYRCPTRSKVGSPLKQDFNHVELYNIDQGGKSLQVPIFTQLLRVEETPIECVICTESIYNVSYDAVDEWIEVCIEFDGDWVWKISRFPKILRARCKHTIEFCTPCLQRHIASQLEQLDKNTDDIIRCPSQTCQRLLAYEEIQLYAQKETFDK
ncbi:e3 ubiquitin ligase ari7 [Fusarium circinatum]|uniref:E3 ubiquitin ligase ari7 n=1 Tax=Fusarium circinatum TaxID=48490 RepID=A0A8H5WXB0_FUSCI|nr:e3 ubiquitin ligase ari7 [Fusarium circinatum]